MVSTFVSCQADITSYAWPGIFSIYPTQLEYNDIFISWYEIRVSTSFKLMATIYEEAIIILNDTYHKRYGD